MIITGVDLTQHFADLVAPLVPETAPIITSLYLGEILAANRPPDPEPLGPQLLQAVAFSALKVVSEQCLAMAGPWRASARIPVRYYLDLASIGFGRLHRLRAGHYSDAFGAISMAPDQYAEILWRAANLLTNAPSSYSRASRVR